MNIRTGDKVIVISGAQKGESGKVIAVVPERSMVYVEKIRIIKRHYKAGQYGLMQGGIVEKEAPIHVSKVALVDKKGNPTRVRIERQGDGSKVRVAVTTGDVI